MLREIARYLRLFVAALCLISCLSPNAFADEYPSRTLTIVVPYGPGGAGDLTARIFAQKMTELTKASVVILNRPGAGFVNSATMVAHGKPDGYTAFLLGNGTAVATQLFKSLPYKMSDFKHVSTISFFDLVLLVNGNSPFKSVADLIAYAKAHPGKMNIGTIATGSTQNLAADLFKSMAGIDAQVVPYDSTSQVVTALRGNEVQAAFEIMPSVIGQITSKALTPLAVTGDKRFSGLPNVPTLAESGLKGYEATSWNGLSLPGGTPDAIVDALAKDAAAVGASPDVRKKLLDLGADARSSTPAEMTARVKADQDKWKVVIDKAGIPRQ
ncbi:Bug family tripartite tricarboxylate transporter substrate binding protein [Paraburkholderia sp.]|uniref:Bug family tripartite tricarboxylate transporter substrate binding protein n=1 Tax=Paraburkholderia sp. TaxID=1926495 RepID=UPI003D6DAAC9